MEFNKELTVVDLIKLLRSEDHWMSIALCEENYEHTYRVSGIGILAPDSDYIAHIYYREVDGEPPIDTTTFNVHQSYRINLKDCGTVHIDYVDNRSVVVLAKINLCK